MLSGTWYFIEHVCPRPEVRPRVFGHDTHCSSTAHEHGTSVEIEHGGALILLAALLFIFDHEHQAAIHATIYRTVWQSTSVVSGFSRTNHQRPPCC
jgi:hypothetical protein